MHWVWSDDPKDWAQQLGMMFTAVAAALTGIYVLLTYRLMRSTASTARLALLDAQRARLARLLPLAAILERLCEGLRGIGKSPSAKSAARLAGLLSEERLRLAACVEGAMYLLDESDQVTAAQLSVNEVHRCIELVLREPAEVGHLAELAVAGMHAETTTEVAAEFVMAEVTRCRSITRQLEVRQRQEVHKGRMGDVGARRS